MGPSDYVLLELLDRLGGVQGRKKLQKLVYISKLAGMPIEDDFFFHYYGPYSSGLASRVDQLVEAGMLKEKTRSLAMSDGVEYGYELTEEARSFLETVRPKVPSKFENSLQAGLSHAAKLKDNEVFELELASTLLYWMAKGQSGEQAEAITEQRKNASRTSDVFKTAKQIAAEIWDKRATAGV
ncbi:MAG: hypothetical protein HZB38_10940 [Planctomycetes bacterium]|nr:hypothetical protein [Planctomycetota bacterium]